MNPALGSTRIPGQPERDAAPGAAVRLLLGTALICTSALRKAAEHPDLALWRCFWPCTGALAALPVLSPGVPALSIAAAEPAPRGARGGGTGRRATRRRFAGFLGRFIDAP